MVLCAFYSSKVKSFLITVHANSVHVNSYKNYKLSILHAIPLKNKRVINTSKKNNSMTVKMLTLT